MQLRQLEYFVAVADARNFTRAAVALAVSQPTLSQQIRALETGLGAPLIVRSPGKLALTAFGEELLPIARRMLAEGDNARRVLAELAGLERGQVRLGATPSLCTGVLPGLLRRFHSEHPGVAIVITEGGSQDLQRQLTAGDLDLALLIATPREESDELSSTRLFVEELVVVSAAHLPPLTTRRRLRIGELRDRQLVMFRQGYDLRAVTVAACRAEGFDPQFAVEGGEMDAVLAFVAAGVGLAVVPRTVADARFRVTPLTPGVSRTVVLGRRRGADLPPAAAELAELVRTELGPSEVGQQS